MTFAFGQNALSGVLRDLDERLEALGIVNRDLAKALAVKRHAGLDETRDELRVADSLGAGSRIDAGNPELAVSATTASSALTRAIQSWR